MQTQSDAVRTLNTVHVGNLGPAVEEKILGALFANCGTVTLIRVAGDPSTLRNAWIEFTEPKCAAARRPARRRAALGPANPVRLAAPPRPPSCWTAWTCTGCR